MKKKYYLVIDTETATLPFVREWELSPLQKKTIAIAKPIVYDMGWLIMDRQGNVIKKASYLVQETFFVPSVFNTAYYKEKRPLYIDRMEKGEIVPKLWNEIIIELMEDLEKVDIATAYNACFDFKKAIPFTERYITALYSNRYENWLDKQKEDCKLLLAKLKESKNEEYLEPFFAIRNRRYPIVDLWGEATGKLLNNQRYKKKLLDNGLLSPSVHYYKTSAETTFQYLINKFDFEEEHTALKDAEIEAHILTKVLKKGKVEPNIQCFPFRMLGNPIEDCKSDKLKKHRRTILELFYEYLKNYEKDRETNYYKRMINEFSSLLDLWEVDIDELSEEM